MEQTQQRPLSLNSPTPNNNPREELIKATLAKQMEFPIQELVTTSMPTWVLIRTKSGMMVMTKVNLKIFEGSHCILFSFNNSLKFKNN